MCWGESSLIWFDWIQPEKLILEGKLLNWLKEIKKTKFKDWNPNYKRWPLIISRVIRIASILVKTLIPHKYSLEFCLGFWTMKIPTPVGMNIIFYLYGSPKMNLPMFWTSWECIRVLEIGYTSWKSRNSDRFLGSDCGPILAL